MPRRATLHTQRARIGLTGLASVFLLVLLAAVFSRASDEQPITANSIEEAAALNHVQADKAAQADAATAQEPLAELGVAPGNATDAADAAKVRPTGDTVAVEDPLRPKR